MQSVFRLITGTASAIRGLSRSDASLRGHVCRGGYQRVELAAATNTEIIFMPGYNSLLYAKGDDCKKLDKGKKQGTVCQPPAVKDAPIPPYDYGYCKQPPPPPLTSCPSKPKKSQKGPCCHKGPDTKKGGCKIR